jgi:hypothetical protein
MSELAECLPTSANRAIGMCHVSLTPGDDGQPDLSSGGQLDYLV